MIGSLPQQSLGIMTAERSGPLPFASSGFYRYLCLLGEQRGIQVFVFSPNRIRFLDGTVTGYSYSRKNRQWIKSQLPLPAFIYDRCFCDKREEYVQYRNAVRRLRSKANIHFIGNELPGKWKVLQRLSSELDLLPILPETKQLHNMEQLLAWLDRKQEAFLKPQGGSQGKGALRIAASRETSDHYLAIGRDGRNRPVHKQLSGRQDLKRWIASFIGRRAYLIQDYLTLHNSAGIAYDIRSLVQKDGRGLWQMTGMAVRCGKPGSVTSNLHGGGKAEEALPFLIREFGEAKAEELIAAIHKLSAQIPPVLESAHGRLVELGIDFGIDRTGTIWILEVNSKPGRDVFRQLHNGAARRLSLERPIEYTEFLLKSSAVLTK